MVAYGERRELSLDLHVKMYKCLIYITENGILEGIFPIVVEFDDQRRDCMDGRGSKGAGLGRGECVRS